MTSLFFNIEITKEGKQLVKIDKYPIHKNKITFLFGESGIGKSLISKAIFGVLDPEELTIKINGLKYKEFLAKNPLYNEIKKGFFVFQEPSTHLNPLLTLGDQLSEGDLKEGEQYIEELFLLWKGKSAEEIKSILEIYPRPYRPSGGEKQRILCLMALKKATILKKYNNYNDAFFVFDEPTGSLDNFYRNLFLVLLFKKFEELKFTATFITHDYSIISFINKNYPHLNSYIEYLELSSNDGKLSVNNFSTEKYINWLKTLSIRVENTNYGSRNEVLKVKSSFDIFNSNFKIYKDEENKIESDLIINSGDIVYLKAPSGEGKTTLCKIIMGLIKGDKFSFNLANLEINEKTKNEIFAKEIWGKRAVMVFQHADEALNANSKVKDVFKGLKGYELNKVKLFLSLLFNNDEITDTFLNKKVISLSGGQKQKLNLLRGLFLNTNLIILDEPVNGMDFESIKKVINLVEQKRREGSAILLISHNQEIFDSLVPTNNKFYLKKVK